MEACINASGLVVNTDGYVRGNATYCYVEITLLNANYNYVANSRQSCTAGHYYGPSGVYLGTYHAEMCVYSTSSTASACLITLGLNNP